jgi:hypothetical protein
MIPPFVVSILRLYFAFFLGIAGLAKIDRPLVEQNGISLRMRLMRLFFSPTAGRVLGVSEVGLAFLLALGIRTGLVTIVNAALFGLFLLFKLFLMLTRQGKRCGCFGAYELNAIDPPSVITSALILGLAIVLAILARWPVANALNWIVAITFLTTFGWIGFKTLRRRWLENKLIQRTLTGPFTEQLKQRS